MSESEPSPPGDPPPGDPPPGEAAAETPEEKRQRVMHRLAEIISAGPPDLSGSAGPVAAGGFPMLPANADEFDQESAAALFAALSQFFEQQKDPGREAGAEAPERE